jgi:RNA polymerase sigma factor (sigma-70 family)
MPDELLERARRGDQEAFGELAAAKVDRLLAIARHMLRDADLAEDATQEALVRCWRQLPKLRDLERFDAWLYRILIRAIADQAGSRHRFEANVRLVTIEPRVGDSSANLADRDQLERSFRRLAIGHRAVVVLHHYGGLPLSEVALALAIPLGTAKSRYHYAMSALRASVEADARAEALP